MTVNPNGLGRRFKAQASNVTELQFNTPTSAEVDSFDAGANTVTVTVPSFDRGIAVFGPINWIPPSGVTPAKGDRVLIVADENRALCVIGYY